MKEVVTLVTQFCAEFFLHADSWVKEWNIVIFNFWAQVPSKWYK